MMVTASGTFALTSSSSLSSASSVRSTRVPTPSSALTFTSPSSVCGSSSTPTSG